MLKIFGTPNGPDCDGFTRRNFLQIGSLAMGGLALPQLLQAEAKAGAAAQRQKSVIMIFLGGGPSHQDMWDIKEDAPLEYRGEFNAIPTSVPGVDVITAGGKIAAPTTFFESEPFRRFAEEAKKHYDLVLYDTPPVLFANESLVLSSSVEAVLMIVSANTVKISEANQAKRLLGAVNANILGVVINYSKEAHARKYYKYYYGKRYYGYRSHVDKRN